MTEDKDRRVVGRISIKRVPAETIESDFAEILALMQRRNGKAFQASDADISRGLERVSWTREIYDRPSQIEGQYSADKDKGNPY